MIVVMMIMWTGNKATKLMLNEVEIYQIQSMYNFNGANQNVLCSDMFSV
jgi:hypothetical protein